MLSILSLSIFIFILVPNIIEVIGNPVIKNGAAKLMLKFVDVSMSFDNKKFVVCFEATNQSHRINTAYSTCMTVVRAKLKISEENLQVCIVF